MCSRQFMIYTAECLYVGSVFSSGMAAINAIVTACCRSGDNIVVGKGMYPGAVAFFKDIVPRYGVSVNWVKTSDLDALKTAIDENTKVIIRSSSITFGASAKII